MNPFPSTAELLVSGQDPRLQLNATTAANHYLCHPYPDADLLRFGSSTASTIDAQGWKTANLFRNQMAQASVDSSLTECCEFYQEKVCNDLKQRCQLHESTTITLLESGTFAHRIAAQIAQQNSAPHTLQAMVMQPTETGSGVPTALALDGTVQIHAITLRDDNGSPLSAAVVDHTVIQQTEQIMQQPKTSLLLVLVHGSKSGLVVPSLATVLGLKQRFPDRIHLLLDGCQFRFDNAILRQHLDQDVMVAITGSKFLAGPSFSAALLTPNGGYTIAPPSPVGAGLLLRWQIALSNLKTLQQQAPQQRYDFIANFAHQVQQRLVHDTIFSPLPTPPLPHSTIFPFLLHNQYGPLSLVQELTIYQQLQLHGSPKIQLGRPFHAGTRADGQPIGALRLSLSAPLIIDAIANKQQHAVINQAMQALDHIQACVQIQGKLQGITH